MKIFDFNYTKKNGDKSKRRIMVLHSLDNYIDGIDLTKLTEEEVYTLKEIQLKYEAALKPFITKGFRRFLKEGMEIIQTTKGENT